MRLLNFSLAVCTIVAILFSGAHASAKNPFIFFQGIKGAKKSG